MTTLSQYSILNRLAKSYNLQFNKLYNDFRMKNNRFKFYNVNPPFGINPVVLASTSKRVSPCQGWYDHCSVHLPFSFQHYNFLPKITETTMKLIRVQFLQSTAVSQARLRADNGEKHSLTVPYDYVNVEKQTDQLAETFCKRFYPEMTVRNVGTYKGHTFFELSSNRKSNVPAN